MKKTVLFFLVVSILFSCETTPEKKGDLIPPSKIIQNPINSLKTLKYLTGLLEENESSNLYYLRAKTYLELHEYLKADLDINKAIKGNSEDQDYLYLKALISFHLERFDESLEYAKLISNSDFDPVALNELLTQIYLSKNDLRNANYFLAKLDGINGGFKDSLSNVVIHRLVKAENFPLGMDLDKIPKIQQQDPIVIRAYFTHFQPNRSNFAYQDKLLTCLKLYPSDPHLMRFWARFLTSLKQVNRAEKVYLQVEKLFLTHSLIDYEIGDFYFKARNYPKALTYFSQISAKESNYPKSLAMRSVCMLYAGKKMESYALMDSVKKFYAADIDAQQLMHKYGQYGVKEVSSPVDSIPSLEIQK